MTFPTVFGIFALLVVPAILAVTRPPTTTSPTTESQNKTCPAYEVFLDCGGSCQTLCATLNEPCTIQNIQCPSGCYCIEGYARNSYGDCIPQEYCPPKRTYYGCGCGEIYY